jgi:hypothetical protein
MEKKLFSALSQFQKKCPVIHKGTQGYGYSYADLPAIFDVINPILAEFSLGFTQPICGTKVKTILFHVESGETLESETDIPQGVALAKMNEFQVLGSAITYIRRYALSSMLGIITDKDTDAGGEQVKQVQSAPMTYLNEGTPEWTKCLAALKGDFTINDIKKKYRMTKEREEKLISESLA